NGYVHAMIVHDDGTGSKLYVGGEFNRTGHNGLSCWDGTTWCQLPDISSIYPNTISAMTVFNGELLVGGGCNEHYVGIGNYIARWDGQFWNPLGTGLNDVPSSLAVFDDGSGQALYVAGDTLNSAGGVPVNQLARWDGSSWSAVGTG